MRQPLHVALDERDAETYRLMLSVALAQLHAQLQRIAALDAQLQALRDEIARYVAMRV